VHALLRLASFVALIGVSALSARADVPVPADVVVSALAEIRRAPDTPQAYARFLGLLPSLDALSPEARQRWLERLAGLPAPLLAARARLELLEHFPDGPSVASVAAELGFLRDWLVLGPGPLADPVDAQAALLAGPPPAPGRSVAGATPPRVWSTVAAFGPPGAVSAEPFVLREAPTTVHLTSAVTVSRRTRGVLRLGATGDLAVALDGRPVGRARGLGNALPDQLEVPLDLAAGRHQLLLTLATSNASRALVYARFTDPAGRALTTVHPVAPTPEDGAWGVANIAAQHSSGLGYSSLLARLSRDAQRDPNAALDAAVLRRALGLPDDGSSEAPSPLLEDLLLALPDSDAAAPRLIALGHVPREEARASILVHWGTRGVVDPALTLALAQIAAERGQFVRARDLLVQAASAPPDLLALVRARVDQLDGLPETAFTTLLTAEGRPAVAAPERTLLTAARAALALDRPDVARDLLATLARAFPGRVEYRAALAQAALTAGDVATAVDAYATLAERRPDLPGYALEAARLAAAAGDPAGARPLLDRALAAARWSPDLLDALAPLLITLGDPSAAVDALERSLLLRPASPDARAALERLRTTTPEPSPLETELTPALAATPPLDPAAPFELLADEVVTDVHADGSAIRHVARLMRVQRVPDDRDERTVIIPYDPSRELVRVLHARVHRGDLAIANLVRQHRDVGERWYGLYYDQRELAIPFDDLRPGDIIAVAWRVDAVGQLFPGVFCDLDVLAPNLPTHTLRRTVRAPAALGVRTRLDLPDPALADRLVESHDRLPDGRDSFTVRGHDLPASPREPFMPGLAEVAPVWQLSTFPSWAALASWYAALLDEQRALSPAMRAFADAAVRDATGPAGVSRPRLEAALAAAVTRNVRYVGLEFGVHGFKPYRTDDVWARRFGDCKDQASLLTALLDAAGSAARVALVRTRGLGRLAHPLPNLALFDHAIVFLPDRDLYLDPTAASFGVGELPRADQGALALIAHPTTTAPTSTPVLPASATGLDGDYSISLHPDGTAGVQGVVTFRGALAPPYRDLLVDPESRDTQLERLLNGRYPGLRLSRAEVSDPTDTSRPLDVTFNAEAPHVAVRTTDALELSRPAGGDGQAERLASALVRRQPLVLGPPSHTKTAFHYELPLGWTPRELPPSRERTTSMGSFSVRWSADTTVVHVHTALTLATDQVPVADYPAFRAFIQAFDEAVRPPLVLIPRPEAPAVSGGGDAMQHGGAAVEGEL